MKEAAPRIFRSLEQTNGAPGFDAIVRAAVAAYGSLRTPTEAQARDLARLVAPLWQKVSPETQRSVSASLSHAPRMPRALVQLLLDAPVEIAAPFLVSSPSLTEADLSALAARGDERLKRIAESRRRHADAIAPPQAARPAPRSEPSPLPEIAAPPLEAHTLEEPERPAPAPAPQEPFATAAFVRSALRRLAKASRTPAPEGPQAAATLLLRARSRDAARFYATLQELLGLSLDQCARIEADAQGRELAVALRALDIGAADALGILMMMKPGIGLDVGAFERMRQAYAGLGLSESRSRLDAVKRLARKAGSTRATATRSEAQPPQFGRRKTRPAEKNRGQGS
ncbi:hypothetical protein [Aureimonas populi]|uniref:DUF2336 domain-containing protein n=1 Tax=Aureimonas populi TaxID=1701758 RepID=A0ABW5CIK8_9HYPH|nr:hypothetical protein [Aureimonas populi]